MSDRLYDLVAADTTESGRATLAALDAIELHTRMRAKAYFATKGFRGRYGFTGAARSPSTSWFMLLFVVWLLLLVASMGSREYIVWAALALGLILVGRFLFVLVATPVLAHRAIIEIRKTRIILQYGLFKRRTYTAEVYWVREVTWSQNFVQNLFGEATIALHLDTPMRTVVVLSLPGIVPFAETQGYVDKLRDVVQKLRYEFGRSVDY